MEMTDLLDLTGRHALVTGASGGLGWHFAREKIIGGSIIDLTSVSGLRRNEGLMPYGVSKALASEAGSYTTGSVVVVDGGYMGSSL